MNNQAIIENLLDMWLSQRQLGAIKDGWNAFYNDPSAYKGTIVVEMVRQFVNEYTHPMCKINYKTGKTTTVMCKKVKNNALNPERPSKNGVSFNKIEALQI